MNRYYLGIDPSPIGGVYSYFSADLETMKISLIKYGEFSIEQIDEFIESADLKSTTRVCVERGFILPNRWNKTITRNIEMAARVYECFYTRFEKVDFLLARDWRKSIPGAKGGVPTDSDIKSYYEVLKSGGFLLGFPKTSNTHTRDSFFIGFRGYVLDRKELREN